MKAEPIERFIKMVRYTSHCHLWTGFRNRKGYGHFWNGKQSVLAHRFIYEETHGPIPDELQIDHICRTRHCVNPEHMEPVTLQENLKRSPRCPLEIGDICKHGHKITAENLYELSDGRRECKECRRIRSRRWARKKRGSI